MPKKIYTSAFCHHSVIFYFSVSLSAKTMMVYNYLLNTMTLLNSKKWRKITWRDWRLFFICLGGGGCALVVSVGYDDEALHGLGKKIFFKSVILLLPIAIQKAATVTLLESAEMIDERMIQDIIMCVLLFMYVLTTTA